MIASVHDSDYTWGLQHAQRLAHVFRRTAFRGPRSTQIPKTGRVSPHPLNKVLRTHQIQTIAVRR